MQRLKDKIGALLVPGNKGAWPEVRDQLNSMLRGWMSYFSYGTRMRAYRAIDNHLYRRVRNFLVRRHKVQGRGTRRFPGELLFEGIGVLGLERVHRGGRRGL